MLPGTLPSTLPSCQLEEFDGLGSVVALTDSNGTCVQTYEYSVYGHVAAQDPNHPNPFMFTGRQFDIETGLYHIIMATGQPPLVQTPDSPAQ
jgi:hypothetical protein